MAENYGRWFSLYCTKTYLIYKTPYYYTISEQKASGSKGKQLTGYMIFLAKRANLDLKTFWDCIRASAGNSFVWETGGPMVFQGTYDPSFTIELQNKDNQLGYQIAKKYKVCNGHLRTCNNRERSSRRHLGHGRIE